MAEESLKEYGEKRDFTRTPEPPPFQRGTADALTFVIQKHAARRLHYDFRLEMNGVLKSWSVPNGPSLDPGTKRLAVMVEDHPADYSSFEGVIPKGEYGAGQVIIWDRGTYSPEKDGKLFFDDRARAQEIMRQGLDEGKISFYLKGNKLKGSWALVRMHGGKADWLLIKHNDEFARTENDILDEERSVVSGLTIDDIKSGRKSASRPEDSPKIEDVPGVTHAPLPSLIAPMLATLTNAPFSDPEWIFEPKLDGYRIITFIKNRNIVLRSRRGLDVSGEYPYLVEDLKKQDVPEMVLDGEVIALDENGRPCFQCLQQHLKLIKGEKVSETNLRIIYYVFDILYVEGYDLRQVRLLQRKQILSRTLRTSGDIRLIDFFERDGQSTYDAAIKNGLEGVMAKRKDSVYESGRRSRNWLKIKAILSDEFIIGGYTRGSGNRSSTFGALLLGYYDEQNRLVYSGNVGTGFDEPMLNDLKKRMDSIKAVQSPFLSVPSQPATVTWVKPEMVAEIKFAQWTHDGYLRAPVFMRLREDKSPAEVRRDEPDPPPVNQPLKQSAESPVSEQEGLLKTLAEAGDNFDIKVQGNKISINNLNKVLWSSNAEHPPLTKRDLLVYLVKVSSYILPHLKDRPLTLSRYPDGISGEHFFQKHWSDKLPDFVETVRLSSEHVGGFQEYLLCNNLATLVWLGQIADLELHTWFSRINPLPENPDLSKFGTNREQAIDSFVNYPDFIIFDMDPYIYSGKEAQGEEPELNRQAFARVSEMAVRLKEVLDSLSLSAFIKTSGRTGLHIFVPIVREFDYAGVRAAAGTISRFLLQRYPGETTTEWSVEKRAGKIFLDFNQNTRGKTLASVYSPRPAPEATVSMAIRWDELGKVYPTDFTILTAPARLNDVGDLWEGILEAKHDLKQILGK